jgi:hypothetical protein
MTHYKYELTGAMLLVGIIAFIIAAVSHSVLVAAAASIPSMAVYLAGARFSLWGYAVLSRWSYRGAAPQVTTGERSIMIVLWPLCLPLALVIYGLLGVVNRIIPDDQP